MKIVSAPETVAHFEALYNSCEIRYGDMKKQLADDIISYTDPIRNKINDILADTDYLTKVARMGADGQESQLQKPLAK
jgi:tryptophanyl-tRNA synthetase